jgi:RNA polymerase sigma-70 factor (ECF subfamily)
MSESLTTQADEVLLQQFDTRGDDAFDVLVARYKDRLIGLAHWLLGDPETAWSIAQKVFVRLYFTPRAARRAHPIAVWLHAETLRQVRGHQRRKRWASAVRGFVTRAGAAKGASDANANSVFPAPGTPDQERLRLGLSILPDPLKEVYVLCDLQGLSYGEVGSILRFSEAEVQAHIEKARVVFREIVYPKEEEGQ